MNSIVEQGGVIALAIVGVAVLAILVSDKSNTSGVIQSIASGFSNALGTAESPVTGANVSINTSYPGSQGTMGLSF